MVEVKERDFEKLRKIINELREGLLIVEGKNDKKAFESIGVKNVITYFELKKNINKIDINSCIYIMTDTDAEGNRLSIRIAKMLEHNGVKKIDTNKRKKFS